MVNAFKAKLSFADTDGYLIFLKRHLLELNPKYYVVSQRKKIKTSDGIMYALRITEDVEIPDLEPIAECWINSTFIYLWRNYCWTIAVDRRGQRIIKYDKLNDITSSSLFGGGLQSSKAPYGSRPEQRNKTIIIHKVGQKLEL